MAETFPESAIDDSSGFDEFMRHHSPTDEKGIENYYETQDALRLNDQPVWIVRNFYADQGRIYDYYVNKQSIGFIEAEGVSLVTAWLMPHSVNGEPEKIFEGPGDDFEAEFVASKSLIEYIAEAEYSTKPKETLEPSTQEPSA